MHAEYLVYDDQDRRVIVSLGTRPKAWQRKIAARNHNVFLVQSFAIRLLRSGSHRAAGGCKSSGDGGTAKSGAARQPCHRHPITSFGKGQIVHLGILRGLRSEERRVGKEGVSTCRSRWSPYH